MAQETLPADVVNGEWLAEDAASNPDRWIHRLTPDELEDIDQALRVTQEKGHTGCGTMTKEDFPLRESGPALAIVLEKVENDMGMFVLRGIPTEKYTKDEMRMIYWGIGLHLGKALSQSPKGDFLGDVKNFGDAVTPWSSSGRGYMSRKHLGFHTDSCDVVALMVLTTAKQGGLSMICSSIAVRNEIARRRPDLLKVLYEDFYWSWKGCEPDGGLPYYKYPVMSEEGGRFSCKLIPPHIFSAQDYPELPRLTEKQKEALKFVGDVANEEKFHFAMMFEPGDIQFLNNHITFHARTEFDDGDTMETRRHLLRMWLAPHNSRKLSPRVGEFYRDQQPGALRGGFPSRGPAVYETVATDV